MDEKNILAGLVRVGKVMAVDNGKRLARVKYEDVGIISDWLPVLANQPYIPDYDMPQRTEYEAGGSGYAEFENHKHDLIIKPWMPKVNDTVVTLYLPVFNADGVVLGGII